MVFETLMTEEFVKSFKKLDNSIKRVAEKKIGKILESPLLGKPLQGRPGRFSERFLQFRIVYEVSETTIIFIRIGKRDEVYRNF